jgi:hypothetical protein
MTTGEGYHNFSCYTSLPNGEPEGYHFNDASGSNFFVNVWASAITGLYEGFDGNGFPQAGWTLNSSSIIQWGETPLTRLNGMGAGVLNNFEWSGIIGQYKDLQLPLLNISSLNNTDFSFDYAYAAKAGMYGDSLQVSVSADCGETWQTLFYKGGTSLLTAGYTDNLFYPRNPDQWKHETFSLSGFTGDILIRFRARIGNSNNLYVDNIAVGWVGVEESAVSSQHSSVIAYPNPAHSSIEFLVSSIDFQWISLKIYNAQGQEVATVVDEKLPEGEHTVRWDAGAMPAGIYFYRLTTNDQRPATGKLVLK